MYLGSVTMPTTSLRAIDTRSTSGNEDGGITATATPTNDRLHVSHPVNAYGSKLELATPNWKKMSPRFRTLELLPWTCPPFSSAVSPSCASSSPWHPTPRLRKTTSKGHASLAASWRPSRTADSTLAHPEGRRPAACTASPHPPRCPRVAGSDNHRNPPRPAPRP